MSASKIYVDTRQLCLSDKQGPGQIGYEDINLAKEDLKCRLWQAIVESNGLGHSSAVVGDVDSVVGHTARTTQLMHAYSFLSNSKDGRIAKCFIAGWHTTPYSDLIK